MNISLNYVTINKNKIYYKHYYANLEDYYLSWYLPITIFVGLVGGIACVIFLILSKIFPKNVLIWMISICLGDIMILIFDASRMLIKVYFDFDVRDINDGLCKIHSFLSNYFFYWSSYMQACMSVQRLFFMLRPLQARSLFSDKLIFIFFGVVSILIIVPVMPYLVFWNVGNASSRDCEPSVKGLYQVTTIIDTVIWGIIPLATMTASTIGISLVLFQAKSERLKLANHNFSSGNNKQLNSHTPPDSAWHVTRLLISMNILYLVSSYPLLMYQIYLNSDGDRVGISIPQQLHKTIYYFLRSLCYLGCSWNWIFYCMGGRKFRERAMQLSRNIFNWRRSERMTEARTKLVTASL